MRIKNLIYAVCEQLLRPQSWRNIFITHDAFGIFSRYSHISRSTGQPKMMYLSRSDAQKVADVMSKKYGIHFSVYKCVWCDGWHIGKNSRNKVKPDYGTMKQNISFVKQPNILFEALRQYPIVDLAPVYDRGVRGRTLSARESNWLLVKLRESGVKVIIDLRTADHN